ncbi:pollen-specific leucine-rich repeat extensin-like protein 1 isoform X2 [Sinocyclocheilus rhinocerous]|uniref:pollen-specific leucine-rich repeat extensin-like protein 1 isoform X2 n=1 Tax=Sinocyclocheilus rhinocerous TaxID=307959 RepID=UPI0007B7E127|nr:PREDICTED: pollen-specific leucine-rich repeat extensin-like protein 1 isoform X2 [Sinocyclocheilus rhinocerous]
MALFSSVFRQLFERFAHFLRRRETPLRAQQCAAQERAALEKLPEASLTKAGESEAFDFTAKNRKCRRRRRQPIEGELPVLPSVSEHLPVPAVRFKPLPPVTRPPIHPQKPAPAPEEVSLPCSPLQVYPPKPLAVPPRPTPAPDELFSLRRSQVSPPRQLVVPQSPTPESDEVVDLQRSSTQVCPPSPVKPQPSTSSLFEPPPQLMLIDIEDEETEYVEYTGKTFRACDLPKSESPRPLEAEMKPRQMIAWLESDCEVLEEVWASEVVGVQGFEEVKDNPDEMGDSKAREGHLDDASQKKEMDEHMMKLFCVTSPKGPKNETQHNVNVQQEPKSKRKVPLFLFTWAEEKAKKKEQKKIRKEKQRREKELLLERYRNDPKLKHLLINKHNHHYCSSE